MESFWRIPATKGSARGASVWIAAATNTMTVSPETHGQSSAPLKPLMMEMFIAHRVVMEIAQNQAFLKSSANQMHANGMA